MRPFPTQSVTPSVTLITVSYCKLS
jgi:hypothetical protein